MYFSSPVTRSTRNEKYKSERSKTTNINYPREKKLHSRTPSSCSGEYWAFIGKTNGTGGPYGATR